MTPEYLAGFFDGEGWIGISTGGRDRQQVLRLTLTNTNYAFLAKIHAHYGGRLRRDIPSRPGWKPRCSIHWSHRAAAKLLEQIGPYLILKRPQLLLAQELTAVKALPKSVRCDVTKLGYPRTAETLAKEHDLKRRMHELNRRGEPRP